MSEWQVECNAGRTRIIGVDPWLLNGLSEHIARFVDGEDGVVQLRQFYRSRGFYSEMFLMVTYSECHDPVAFDRVAALLADLLENPKG